MGKNGIKPLKKKKTVVRGEENFLHIKLYSRAIIFNWCGADRSIDYSVSQSNLEIDYIIKDHLVYIKMTSQISLKREYFINGVRIIG